VDLTVIVWPTLTAPTADRAVGPPVTARSPSRVASG